MTAPMKESKSLKLEDLIGKTLSQLKTAADKASTNVMNATTFHKRTADENYLMRHEEAGTSCYKKDDFEWHRHPEELCQEAKCWLCKAIMDQKEKDIKMPAREGTKKMEKWLKKAMNSDYWKGLDAEAHLLKMYEMLTKNDQEMIAEMTFVSWFGAVRLTRAEVTEMFDKGLSYGNCWAFLKILDSEDMSGKNARMAYLCTRDRGNAIYSLYLKNITNKAVQDKKMDKDDAWWILRLGAPKAGNVVEAIMGYYTI
jgi:hypothetical protein